MTPTEIAILAGAVPFLAALTAWLRAEVANRSAKAANAAVVAHTAATAPVPGTVTTTQTRSVAPDNPDKNN